MRRSLQAGLEAARNTRPRQGVAVRRGALGKRSTNTPAAWSISIAVTGATAASAYATVAAGERHAERARHHIAACTSHIYTVLGCSSEAEIRPGPRPAARHRRTWIAGAADPSGPPEVSGSKSAPRLRRAKRDSGAACTRRNLGLPPADDAHRRARALPIASQHGMPATPALSADGPRTATLARLDACPPDRPSDARCPADQKLALRDGRVVLRLC